MFVNKLFTYLRAHISESKKCFNVKPSTHYFHMKTRILADFQICISVPSKQKNKQLLHFYLTYKSKQCSMNASAKLSNISTSKKARNRGFKYITFPFSDA